MAGWVRLCSVQDTPAQGSVIEAEAEGVAICLANVRGELRAVDNVCPHRRAPLGQGWLEGDLVVCPWHSWSFHTATGASEYPGNERVDIYPLRTDGDDILVNLD